jgi:hypothetical protein
MDGPLSEVFERYEPATTPGRKVTPAPDPGSASTADFSSRLFRVVPPLASDITEYRVVSVRFSFSILFSLPVSLIPETLFSTFRGNDQLGMTKKKKHNKNILTQHAAYERGQGKLGGKKTRGHGINYELFLEERRM